MPFASSEIIKNLKFLIKNFEEDGKDRTGALEERKMRLNTLGGSGWDLGGNHSAWFLLKHMRAFGKKK